MAGLRECVTALIFALIISLSLAQELGNTCEDCESTTCPAVESCEFGVVKDECACCDVCARGLGQLCDAPAAHRDTHQVHTLTHTPLYGSCGEYLECKARTDVQDDSEYTCQCSEEGQVCGSDGVTYDSLCHLLARAFEVTDLFVAVRGPCLEAPKIRSHPEDKDRPLGSILVLDCEASGYPVPTITWVLNRLDGSSFELPGDNPSFAVQVRGGPESNMVTGWIQIMRITEENLGIYTCVAKNSEGKASSSATIREMKPGSKGYPKKA